MKKMKNLLVVTLVLLMSLCFCNASNLHVIAAPAKADGSRTSPLKPTTLDLEAHGFYNIKGFENEFYVYRFEETEMVVYYLFGCTYLVGDDIFKGNTVYGNTIDFLDDTTFQFIAISNDYMLFLTNEGKVAISFDEYVDNGQIVRPKCAYDDLSYDEQEAFIYPSSFEKVVQ